MPMPADAHGARELDTALQRMTIRQSNAVASVPPPLSTPPDLLNEIFRFKCKVPSECQDEHMCARLVEHFGAFVASIRPMTVSGFAFSAHDPLVDDRAVPLNAFANEELAQLKRVQAILTRRTAHQRGDIWIEQWLPQYGCALQMEMASASSLALKLVFLDGWEHVVHFPPTGDCIHSAVAKKVSVLNCGTVHPRLKDKLMGGLHSEIAKAKERTGTNRSAAFNEIGHQKTPQFIAMLLRIVFASLESYACSGSSASAARGGTTDVGLHTGGRSRDTCWPLVRGVVKQNLPGCGALFDKAMLMFHFSLLSGRLNDVGLHAARLSDAPTHAFWTDVEDTFAMLQRVVLDAVELVHRGYDAGTLEKKCAVVRKHLFTYVDQIHAHTAAQYSLPSTAALDKISSSMKYQSVQQLEYSDEFNQPAAEGYDPEADARLKLKYYVFVNPRTCSTASLINWISCGDSSSARKTIHLVAVRTIERFLFQKASALEGDRYESGSGGGYESDASEDALDCTPAQLQSILQHYDKHLMAWTRAALDNELFDVEQHSHVLLVKWIAFCLAHQAFAAKYKDLRSFGIALQWQNLSVAVLRDKAAIDALSTVAAYIRTWNASGREPVFDLNDQEPTARFARAFASASETYLSRYRLETERLDRCVTMNWYTIVRKKADVVAIWNTIKEIDESIDLLDEALQHEKAAIEEANLELPPNLRRLGNSETKRMKEQIRGLKGQRHWQTKQLAAALQMPAFIKSPLPKDRASALQTLFFIDMPDDIALLFELCLRAQRALAPKQLAPRDAQAIQEYGKGATWRSFFTANGGTASCDFNAFTALSAYQEHLRAPNNHGPNSVESVKSRDDVAKQCVWYPTENKTHVVWTDANGVGTNPFNISLEVMLASFTHELPAPFKSLQWAISYPGGASRGNLVYSKLGEHLPDDFEKSSFVLFGSLRAYPHQQVRKLCCALKDNVLPWSHPCVAAVVRQAMYQVGQLSDEALPQSVWKTDLRRADGLQVLAAAIEQAASRLNLTPRDFEHVPLLGELAGFISQFAVSAKATVTKFVAMCRRWASDIRAQWQSDRSMSSTDVTELRAKECLLYGYGLQSFALGELKSTDFKAMGELAVLFRNALLFANGSSIWQYYTYKRDGYFESYWAATDKATGTHYAINLFTGAVLTDGNSPGGLPSHIRQAHAYRTLFGAQDFEVAFSRGVYRTTYAVRGCYYEFALVENELHVREVYCADKARVVKTLDLCSSAWHKTLATALPARTMALHSLWYWVEQDCILVRPLSASEKRVEGVVVLAKAGASPCRVVQAYQVPVTDAELPHATLYAQRERYDSFVKVDDALLAVVRKFEADKYIHTLRTSDGMLKIHLPRFRLSFLLTDACALRSLEYEGYVLAPQQQFHDALPNFHRYFVLHLEASSAIAKPATRLLVPFGDVVRTSSGGTDIALPDLASARLNVAVFDVHRRLKTLTTESITSRLLLCTLLASTGLNTPSTFFRMTGSEAALQVLKGCYVSHAFSQRDMDLLRNLCRFGHREPGLKILASCILQKSTRCSFLTTDDPDAIVRAIDCTNELDEYCAMGVRAPERNPLRTCLDETEERLVLGYTLQHETTAKRMRTALVDLLPPPVPATLVRDVEATLASFLVNTTQSSVPSLQLTLVDSDAMSQAMNAELHDSWVAYHTHPDKTLAQSLASLESTCEHLLTSVRAARAQMEQYLMDAVATSRSDITSRLLFMINYLPTPTISDVIRSSFDSNVLVQLAPRLSARARSVFRAAALQFMELCVLEDKLERLVHGAQQQSPPSDTYFVDELSSVRRWSSAEHPYWLAFEVEGRLQIRHEQFVVAQHLIDNTGAVCQMNMGRGKTRVILPMLFLYFSHRHPERLVRAHFLTPLLSETRQFMHQYLSASSVLGLHFVELPFHRNIELSTDRLHLIREVLDEARECGKFLMIAPEHRMSLELKKLDLEASIESKRAILGDGDAETDDESYEMIDVLDEILHSDQYVDILDECDAILHHKYHLIYAVGVPQKLESGESRWLAVEALLRVLTRASSRKVRAVLEHPHVAFQSPEYAHRVGAYNGLRLNASVAGKDAVRRALRVALVLDLMDDPPFAFVWLKAYASHADNARRERLVTALTDPSASLASLLTGDDDPVLVQYKAPLLALRGLLAFGILEHCLEKRHRVEFGLPDPKTRAKRMAIPFRAADIPSERSEFSHPEVAIATTVLAYYHSGLRESELREALTQLLLLGAAEQAQFYTKWYDAVRSTIDSSDAKALPHDAHQLSPRDSRQFALLYRVYRFSMEAINFFLNTCVFPSDTTQYPQRLSRTAWHLAGGSWNIGFSGTNDNHRLLPTSMRQHEPDEPSLVGTNGKMIDRILKVTIGYEIIHSDQSAAIPWQVLLQSAMATCVHALIDTGALLAGVLNNDAAAYLLALESFRGFAGVTYYDTRKEFDCWVVLDAASQLVTPLKRATIVEKDTFVIFDDARSRGSDMKLQPDAVAMLTLGPKITKDKLMQGAGRMRQLGSNQHLWLASLSEVAQSILQFRGRTSVQQIQVVDILDWVMHNTKSEAVHGLLEWASSGLHYGASQVATDMELLDEDWSLDALYATAHRADLIANIVASKASDVVGVDDATLRALVETICARSEVFGLDEEVLVTAHNDECERELHNEHFEEREDENEHARVRPLDEVAWDFGALLRIASVHQLAGTVDVARLDDFVASSLAPPSLAQLNWASAQLYGTRNFFSTVAVPAPSSRMSAYARVIDAMLLFDDGSKLLVSEFEADAILRVLWRTASVRPMFSFVHLPYVVETIEARGTRASLASVALSLRLDDPALCFPRLLDPSVSALCQLYNGETMFTKTQHDLLRGVLRRILQPLAQRERTLQTFADERGNLPKWRYSLLHELCHEMDLEALAAPRAMCEAPNPFLVPAVTHRRRSWTRVLTK